ncbi:MAG TPA: M20/M25/M40 family metallo-hydrolase [Thermoplasmata archaeon]|nr:M20/M25/M40 family metallo-hydrolase [Thermoplasmata archaeon]
MALKNVLERIESRMPESLDALTALCRIPSVSAEKRAQPEAAEAVRKLLQDSKVDARIIELPEAPPVVFGEIRAGDDRPTLLLYNHYDVQPVDPRSEWRTDPFEPVVQDGKLFARGSGDTKGNIVAQVAAVRAFLEADGRVPCNLKFVVEGEEEVGSPHFKSFVEANREILQADGATIEGGEHSMSGLPKVEFGCKGTLYVELTARTAAVDQHSMWAGILPNAAWRLIAALRRLRDEKGRVLIPGWTDTAVKATRQQLAYLRKSEFEERPLLDAWGIQAPLVGKSGYTLIRHGLYNPTCTICGFTSGFQGEGTKTVNPAVASAKVDFRLLPGMKAMGQLEKLKAFLAVAGFADIDVHYHDHIEASATPYDTRIAQACIRAGKDAYGRPPTVWPWSLGASANGFFNEIVGVPAVSGPGVSYEASGYHAPNEHIRLADFANGAKYFAALMARF